MADVCTHLEASYQRRAKDQLTCCGNLKTVVDGIKSCINRLIPVLTFSKPDVRKDVRDSRNRSRHLFVFDFDRTIASYHLWGTHQNADLDSIVITNNTFVDAQSLSDFVSLQRSQGHDVAIATFGRKDVVNKAMAFVF